MRGYVEATRRAGASDLLTLIHCEDDALMADAAAQLTAAGQTSLRHYAESRPVISEVVATQRAVAIAEATGAPVYIVHLSSERALAVCADAQARGVPVYVETRPFYLHLTRERLEETDGAKYVGQPPLRERRDVDALWAGIQQGVVNTVCTDHAPWSLAAKLDPALTITRLRPGAENLQTMLPMLYSEGVRTGRISLRRFVEVTGDERGAALRPLPAQGRHRRRQRRRHRRLRPRTRPAPSTRGMLQSNADYSVYEGWSVTGWPEVTLRRGEIVFEDDTVTGTPGSGALVRRGATALL